MIVWKAVQDLIEVLKLIPENVIPADHIGVKRPVRRQDLPAIVMVISDIEEAPIGIGGLVTSQKISDDQWVESRGSKVSGILSIEIWALDEEEAYEVVNAVYQTLGGSGALIRDKGFTRFGNREMEPIDDVIIDSQGSVVAKKMIIKFSIVYEEVKIDTLGPEGVISQIHVEIDDKFNEKMDIR